ncbi:PIG-L family deacetylase [Candidatus Thorarchaeota archaeon]|nr:PIG-L family deacetylase [Candidatus Thorarchaeota archaeon]TFG97578.1 MAG: PIG-L family deacetylase [Candidatus Thorarchaeota archaeon]
MFIMDSILVVVAHPDDESLGAGGTIRKHGDMDIPVDVHCMTGNETRNEEMKTACGILGVRHLYLSERDDFAIDMSLRNEVVGAILKTRPTIVITHFSGDYNINHQQCAQIVFDAVEWASHTTVFDDAHRVQRIYNMEINTLISRPHVYVDITDTYKYGLGALREHKSQILKADSFYEKLYDTRTRLRGAQAKCERAEAFTITLPEHAGPFYKENSVEKLI